MTEEKVSEKKGHHQNLLKITNFVPRGDLMQLGELDGDAKLHTFQPNRALKPITLNKRKESIFV